MTDEPVVRFYPTTEQEHAVLDAIYALRTATAEHHARPDDKEAKGAWLEAHNTMWEEVMVLWMEAAE